MGGRAVRGRKPNIRACRRCLYTRYTRYMNGTSDLQNAKSCAFTPDSCAFTDGQKGLSDFIRNHVRRGVFHTNIAVLSDKQCAFTDFSLQEKCGSPLKIFYPGTRAVKKEGPFDRAFLTKNPYGGVALLPVGAKTEELEAYRYLIADCWNAPDAGFVQRMLDYVRGGGTLLLTWENLFPAAVWKQMLVQPAEVVLDDDIRALTGVRSVDFSTDVPAAEAVYPVPDSQVIENRVGAGRVLIHNSKGIPTENSMDKRYTALVRQIACENREMESQIGWVSADGWVYTTVYDAPDRRTFYLLDVRWWKKRANAGRAVLHMGAVECGFPVERDVLNVMTLFPGLGVLTVGSTADIRSYDGDTLTLRGMGQTKLVLFRWAEGEIEISERRLELNGMSTEKI